MIEPFVGAKCAADQFENQRTDAYSDHDRHDETTATFLNVLSLVRKIVNGKLNSAQYEISHDLVQTIALRLWSWRLNYSEKSERMTESEWQKFAARTALNEVSRHFTRNPINHEQFEPTNHDIIETSIEGETQTEIQSLISFVWRGICQLSVRQRRALILNSHELTIYLLHNKVTDEELSHVLEIEWGEWLKVKAELPLSDVEIARIKFRESNRNRREVESTPKSIKKARHEARAKMHQWTKK